MVGANSRKGTLDSINIQQELNPEHDTDIHFDNDPDLSKIEKDYDDKGLLASDDFHIIEEVNEDILGGSEAGIKSMKSGGNNLRPDEEPDKAFPKSLFSKNEVLSPIEKDMMQRIIHPEGINRNTSLYGGPMLNLQEIDEGGEDIDEYSAADEGYILSSRRSVLETNPLLSHRTLNSHRSRT